jgi:hypothetical protein
MLRWYVPLAGGMTIKTNGQTAEMEESVFSSYVYDSTLCGIVARLIVEITHAYLLPQTLMISRAAARLQAVVSVMSTSTEFRLIQFSTCEISDALGKLGIPHGGHVSGIHQISTGPTSRICAQAYTVKMVLASDIDAPKLVEHFVDTAPEGHVIVIDAPPSL